IFFFSSRRRHTRFSRDWSSDVCSSDLPLRFALAKGALDARLTLRMAGAPGSMTTLSLTGTATARDVDVRQRDDEPMIAFESLARSEERRVGKACESMGSTES